MESIGTSRNIVNLVISLEKFRTFQMVRNTIHWIKKLLSRKNTQPSGTLMARMAQNQYIQLNSDVYKKGIQQFEGNLKDILEIAKENNIPVILGTLACNLKDQYPFVSMNSKNYPRADIIFKQATEELKRENISKADSLFRLAKDLDALRFRAPSEINRTIVSLANKFRDPIINIDSAFNAMSPYHIVGNNLMTDHLHPTLQGYKIIGKLFYKAMEENKLLPNTVPRNLSNEKQDSLTSVNFNFTSLDSTIGEYRIKLLKNDWPYIKKKNQVPVNKLLQAKDYIDSLAYNLMLNKIDWEPAHRSAANYYLLTKNYSKFIDMMNALISQYPFIQEYYDFAANKLLEAKIFDKAYFYLQGSFNIKPSDFSAKWLGIINLNKGNIESAKKFLLESIKLNSRDAQAWYNLAGCYVNKEDYKSALDAVNNSLKISPQYREAKVLQAQLIQALKSK